jgi:hypothetical protein
MAHGWFFIIHQVDLWRPSFEQEFVLHTSVVEDDCDNLKEGARIDLNQCLHVVQLRYYIQNLVDDVLPDAPLKYACREAFPEKSESDDP